MPYRFFLLAALVFSLSACDSYDDDDGDTSLQVFVADFEFDADDYGDPLADDKTVTFNASDAQVTSGDLDDALETVGDGDMVMLYIDTELVSPVEGADNGTWSALPLVRGFEDIVFGDTDGDGVSDGDIAVTGLVVSYEYSFDNDDLYFDVVSSLPYTDFTSAPEDFFDSILPARFGQAPDEIRLRLVVIPDELFFSDSAAARIDLRDYEAVKQAYNLPD